jgi:hypothetical protein
LGRNTGLAVAAGAGVITLRQTERSRSTMGRGAERRVFACATSVTCWLCRSGTPQTRGRNMIALDDRYFVLGQRDVSVSLRRRVLSRPDGDVWLLMIFHRYVRDVTVLVFRVDAQIAEAASIFALPGLLVGVYEINSFQYVFPILIRRSRTHSWQ